MKTFAENVMELIEEKKLSQKDLSKISGVSEPSLCRYLKEDGPSPRMDIVINVANALGVTPNYLLGKEDAKDSSNDFEEAKILVARNKKVFTEEQKAELIKLLFK